ncbi:MAG: acyl--CoA ligase [Microthrixaceae bacterium]|nr:acyl--CoA ligase [Microthrixaceae bacterium]MCB1010191.1 acyl--CoA ligase [Microthrixaceae bacterium]MCB9387167.1 acyl--CoA ligase [Microthrixaceae bacterium]MCO5321726.1 acyl--CoA ligase [Microthrixaceae bacterium]
MLAEAVRRAADTRGGNTAISRGDSAVTWAEVHQASVQLASRLAARGVAPGDTVALCMHSTERWIVAATAANRLGATIAGVSPVVTATEREAMVSLVDPALVLADRDLLDGIPLRTNVVEFSEDGLQTEPGAPSGPPPEHRADPREDFAICFTSGTTGAPKAARFTVGAARAVQQMDAGGRALPPPGSPGPQIISSTQFAHVGFVLKLPGHALSGSTIHVMQRWNAAEAIELIEKHRVTTLGVVAPQLALILRAPALDTADVSCLRLVIAGGAPSPGGLITAARERLGVDYSIRWSSTESGGVGLAAMVDDETPEAIGTIGHPRPAVEARVAAEGPSGASELPPGEIGELQIRSAAMMAGYVGDPAATRDAFTDDGWLRTGDLAQVRSDGRFVLAGRRTDMFIRGGYNVHPAEVEEVLMTHPEVAEVAVVPRPDDVMGHIGVAVVVPREGAEPGLEELRAHAADRLSKHKLPEELELRGSLPATRAGKLDRAALARELVAGSEHPPEVS